MTSLPLDLESLRQESQRDLETADSLSSLESLRLKWLGRKDGRLTAVLQQLPSLSPAEKKDIGRKANELKVSLESAFSSRQKFLENAALELTLSRQKIDGSLPAVPLLRGGLHPLTQVMDDITDAFERLGFRVAEGPEVEDDDTNFTALNHPPDHPARDAHDTFYLKHQKDAVGRPLLMRTHTSPVQIRYLKATRPPVYIVSPGRVFRHENVDATHSHVFHQVEGLAVDRDISLADLKGALAVFAESLFGSDVKVRLRPSYFPFVEPGAEVDISCTLCNGKGCRVCKMTGWVEMLGAGLVHPNVLRGVGLDPEVWSGYAFGIGVERVAMFRHGVNDLRHFFENDLRFLELFA